jgi:hypothetical protein
MRSRLSGRNRRRRVKDSPPRAWLVAIGAPKAMRVATSDVRSGGLIGATAAVSIDVTDAALIAALTNALAPRAGAIVVLAG